MRERGVEPLIPHGRRILSPLHIPVLPLAHKTLKERLFILAYLSTLSPEPVYQGSYNVRRSNLLSYNSSIFQLSLAGLEPATHGLKGTNIYCCKSLITYYLYIITYFF